MTSSHASIRIRKSLLNSYYLQWEKIMLIITEKLGFPLCDPTDSRNETGSRHLNLEGASEEDPNRHWEDEERTNG